MKKIIIYIKEVNNGVSIDCKGISDNSNNKMVDYLYTSLLGLINSDIVGLKNSLEGED